VPLKELVSCLDRTLLGQFLREICPLKRHHNWNPVNSFHVMAVNKRPTFGVIFLKGHISLKNWPKRLLFRHDTNSFKGACLFTYLKEAKADLYGPHLHCYKPVPTYFMKRTVECLLGIKSGSRKSV
jgi:hypothetical protein